MSFLPLCRKLLREHQLEAVTKAAQQDELERRRRLEQQSKQDFPVPLLPEYTTGENDMPSSVHCSIRNFQTLEVCFIQCLNRSTRLISFKLFAVVPPSRRCGKACVGIGRVTARRYTGQTGIDLPGRQQHRYQ